LLGRYLAIKDYVTGDDIDGCQPFVRSDLHISDESAYVIASPARSIQKEYNGILFKVVNLGLLCSNGEQSYRDLPIALHQRFRYCPNYIEIDSYIMLYHLQLEIGHDLESWLKSRGRNAYIREFDGEFIDILETAYDDPYEKSYELEKLINEFLGKNQIRDYKFKTYPKEFSMLLPRMHPHTITVLKTAEIIESTFSSLPDYSPIVIEYCKAIEIELADKVLEPLRSYWLSTRSSSSQPIPDELKNLKKYLFKASPKPLELGTLAKIIEAALSNNSNPIASSLIDQVNDLSKLNKSPKQLIEDILYLTRNFRNPAAHKSILSRKQLDECKKFVIGLDKKPGMLFRIVKAA